MLKELYIENLAIIEKAVVTFDKAFNVFSGETGAGKSILIGGINAVLGGRVSKDIVRAGAEKAVITALFDALPLSVCEKLNEYGYGGYADGGNGENSELTLTREISDAGNSTARVNGKTATAAVLKEIASALIDVHGQHQTRMITAKETQMEMLDRFGNIPLGGYQSAFREFSGVSKRIKTLEREAAFKHEKIEILTEKIADVAPYKIKIGEEDEVAGELKRMSNIRKVSQTLHLAYFALNGGGSSDSPGAVNLLNLCKDALSEASEYIGECEPLKERLTSAFIELDDIKQEISPLIEDASGESADSKKFREYEERVSDFQRLRRKYGLSMDELVLQTAEWKSELEELQGGDELLQRLTDEKKRLGDKVKRLGGELTQKRKQTAEKLSALICKELEYLDMPGTKLMFDIKTDKVTVSGMDSVEMLIAVNKGEDMKPLAKIASGGELSRIMLAIKVVSAGCDESPASVVFDEIDSGISGRAAHKVGLKLSELSKERQVLCVTHLAQIAAMADNHLLIEKDSGGGRTYTSVKKITGEERKRELARIISGDEDELSLANAERLMNKG